MQSNLVHHYVADMDLPLSFRRLHPVSGKRCYPIRRGRSHVGAAHVAPPQLHCH
jgi:hypothetical protein